MRKSAHTSIDCFTHGYDTETEQDVELPSVFVTVWVHQGVVGKALELECRSPQELWGFVRAMNNDRAKTLKETFNYTETAPKSGLPVNLGDLFS